MKNIEIELKFQILGNIEDFLNTLKFVKKRRIIDIYLDTKTAELYKKGIFIRIRNSDRLDFKYNLNDPENRHEHCEEHSFPLPLKMASVSAINTNCRVLNLSSRRR
jgi:adenylate cyclase class IV